MKGSDESSNPYAPPATESTPSSSALAEDSDLARLIARLPSRRRAFATVLSIGGWLHAIGGAGALATGVAEGMTISSPYLGIGIAALGLGAPLALLGALLALRVRLANFIAFPLTCICGGMGGVGVAIAVERASVAWSGADPPAIAIALMMPTVAFLAGSVATGYVFHRTVMSVARAGVPLDAIASDRP